LYAVADIANLPFVPDAFDGVVSIHAIHHLPLAEHSGAYLEIWRVLKSGHAAAIVDGWYRPLLMRLAEPLIYAGRLLSGRSRKRKKNWLVEEDQQGTFVQKMTPSWLKGALKDRVEFQIFAWRSLSPRFMRWFIRPRLAGRACLRIVFRLEDRFPRFFGEHGQYPLIIVSKPQAAQPGIGPTGASRGSTPGFKI
jgi:hypothetical protein